MIEPWLLGMGCIGMQILVDKVGDDANGRRIPDANCCGKGVA